MRANLDAVRAQLGDGVEILAATKYVPLDQIGVLAEAGVTLAGENRAQDLAAKAAAHPELTWDFIGQLQSRKVKQILPHVRYIHSVASDSALRELGKHGTPDTRVLVEVNVAEEPRKAGILPGELPAFLEACPVEVVGLMTMPPYADDPEDSRRWFAALRELAERHGLRELSMGTTQDYAVAAQEGATIVRIGSRLYT
ncbi:MAG TPA: YggS family pyridoxal phosphate enzyme [Solirubrobacteraceae bacterium]